MSGMNKVILIGRVGKDAELRKFENGSSIATLSLATSETYKDKSTGERKEVTEWHNLVGRQGLSEIMAKYVKKGDMISVVGKLKYRTYDKQDGTKGYTTEVIIEELTMLSGKKESAPAKAEAEAATDDLPY